MVGFKLPGTHVPEWAKVSQKIEVTNLLAVHL